MGLEKDAFLKQYEKRQNKVNEEHNKLRVLVGTDNLSILENTIAVYSTKGGVGKTTLSFALYKALGYKYISNDESLASYLMTNSYQPKKLPLQNNTVYDFGGFVSEHNYAVLFRAEVILVPLFNESNAIIKATSTINDLIEKAKILNIDISKRIVLVGIKVETNFHKNSIKDRFNQKYPDLKLSYKFLVSGKFLPNILETNSLPEDLYRTNDKTLKDYGRAYKNFTKFVDSIKNKFWLD